MFINYSDIASFNIQGSDYYCIISLTSKNEAINVIQNADVTEKSGTLLNIKKIIFIYKNDKEIFLIFGNIEIEKNKFYRHKFLGRRSY